MGHKIHLTGRMASPLRLLPHKMKKEVNSVKVYAFEIEDTPGPSPAKYLPSGSSIEFTVFINSRQLKNAKLTEETIKNAKLYISGEITMEVSKKDCPGELGITATNLEARPDNGVYAALGPRTRRKPNNKNKPPDKENKLIIQPLELQSIPGPVAEPSQQKDLQPQATQVEQKPVELKVQKPKENHVKAQGKDIPKQSIKESTSTKKKPVIIKQGSEELKNEPDDPKMKKLSVTRTKKMTSSQPKEDA